jgi:hypothetical protein
VTRLALNMNQVEEWRPPRNPAKETDSRFAQYSELYGEDSWELDAVKPETLARLVEDRIEELIDHEQWSEVLDAEREMRDELHRFARDYESRKK